MSGNQERAPLDLDRLLFRRQFILGPRPFAPAPCWSTVTLQRGLHLSSHDDLPVVTRSKGGVVVALIGVAIDVRHPERTESAIVDALLAGPSDMGAVVASSSPLAGRWIIVLQNDAGTHVLTDPCGFRQVFYTPGDAEFWCGSQPAIIAANRDLRVACAADCLAFMTSRAFSRNESAWIGPKTVYDSCFHLMPNHYLEADTGRQIRFFPGQGQDEPPPPDPIGTAATYLANFMSAAVSRYACRLALTSGWDSRVLLAASRDVHDDIVYYVDRKRVLRRRDADVWVPKLLSRRLKLDFVVENSTDAPPGWFVMLLSENVTSARALPKTRMIYRRLLENETYVNINGNVSELFRNNLDREGRVDPLTVDAPGLTTLLGYEGDAFATAEIEEWMQGVGRLPAHGPNLIDLVFWEQRLGNWGAQLPAERDIAGEELSPYNCRALIEALLSTPREMRAAPEHLVYRRLMEALWPAVTSAPINPPARWDLKDTLKHWIKPYLTLEQRRALKRLTWR